VLDDHAGAKLCGFDAAHNFSRPCGRRLPKVADFGNSSGPLKYCRLRAE
jgi:hypothetical protein